MKKVRYIYIPRTVPETSMPYIVDLVEKEFGNSNNKVIITRPENASVMSKINYVDKVLTINTNSFSKKTQIIEHYNNTRNSLIVLPINNITVKRSFRNVIQFIGRNFKTNKIYYCSFDEQKIYRYTKDGILFRWFDLFIKILSSILSIVLFIIFIICSYLKIFFNKKKEGSYKIDNKIY